jgi:hypothetical protein
MAGRALILFFFTLLYKFYLLKSLRKVLFLQAQRSEQQRAHIGEGFCQRSHRQEEGQCGNPSSQ